MKLSDYVYVPTFVNDLEEFEKVLTKFIGQDLEEIPGFIQWEMFEAYVEQDSKRMLKTLIEWLQSCNHEKKTEQMFASGGKNIAKSYHKRG